MNYENARKIDELLNHLKPCPFCGGSPELVSTVEPTGITHYVRCKICYTFNGFGKVFEPDEDREEDTSNQMLSALIAWNKRSRKTA